MRVPVFVVAMTIACAASAQQFSWGNLLEANAAEAGGQFYTGEELYRRGSDAFVIGYVAAVHDSDLTAKPIGERYCVPRGATTGQMADVARKFLEANPAVRHQHAAHLLRQAWRAAWPCPPQ